MLVKRRGVLAMCILALLALPAPGIDGEASRATPPPPSGDWTVADATSVSSTTIVLWGNLTVMPGGILTLDQVTLVLACTFGGQFCVTVRAGGELHLRQSNLTAQNLSRKFDFTAEAGSVLEMTQSEVHGAGSRWVDATRASGIVVRTSSATFTGTVFTQNSVALDIRNCSPSVTGCTFDGNRAALVALNSSLTFRDCTVGNSSFGGLHLYDRTNITIAGCEFDGNAQWGVYANHSSIRLDRDTFRQNYLSAFSSDAASLRISDSTFTDDAYVSITAVRCPAVILDNVTVRRASRMALRVDGSAATAWNSTLESGLYDVQLDTGSSVGLVNCTFKRHNLNFQDGQSRLNISWFLGARVRWWSDGTPVGAAAMTVTNGTGNLTASGATSVQGLFRWAVAIECTLGMRENTTYGPYNVTARKAGLTRTVGTPVDRSLEVDLLLDDIGPAIQVDFPAPGAFLGLTRLTVRGISWDNETNVASIECRVDNGSFVSAAGTSFWEFTTGTLVNGPHNVTVRGRDTSNNTNQVVVPFSLDTISPTLTISAPPDGGFTRGPNVTVVGTTEKNATVTVNGTPVNVTAVGGNFNLTVDLSEGDNYIQVVSTDRAQNRAVRTVRFRRDTIVTPIEINPPNGTWTNQTEITLFGRVEENSTMLVRSQDPYSNFTTNETRLNVTTGNFTVKVALRNGANLFRIDILDGAGNNATVYLTIFQDRLAPMLNVSSPTSPLVYTRDRRLMLEGRTEPGASLFLNGRAILVEEGNFSKALTLDVGENVMNLTAMDSAGNAVSVVYRAVLDRTPPVLLVESPRELPYGKTIRTDRGTFSVRGTTEPGARLVISVNGQEVNGGRPIPVDDSGAFRRDVWLSGDDGGVNVIEVTAYDLANNSNVVHRLVKYVPVPPLVSNDQWIVIGLVIGIAVAIVAVVAWDTRKNTGRWGIRRPAWFRVPDIVKERGRAIRAFVPKPEFGREEVEAGIGAVPAEPGKEAKEPGAAGAPAPPPAEAQWDAAGPQPAADAPPVPPVPAVGKEFSVSEKPSAAPVAAAIPAATELPVAEPAGGAPVPSGAAKAPAPGGPPPGPAPPPAAPPPPPPEPPKPKEVDPLAEILGAPTRKL